MSLFFKPDEVASYMKGIPEEALKNRHVFLDDKNIFSNSSVTGPEPLQKGFNNAIGFPPSVVKDAFQAQPGISKVRDKGNKVSLILIKIENTAAEQLNFRFLIHTLCNRTLFTRMQNRFTRCCGLWECSHSLARNLVSPCL
jgi:hypothetical protein